MLSDRCPVCLSVTLVHCRQMVGRIKMKLGVQVGLGPGYIMLDGDPAPPPLFLLSPLFIHSPLIFGQCPLWPNDWIDENTTWYSPEVDFGPGHIVLEGIPALRERGTAPPSFRPMSIVAMHGRPSQLLLSSCYPSFARNSFRVFTSGGHSSILSGCHSVSKT